MKKNDEVIYTIDPHCGFEQGEGTEFFVVAHQDGGVCAGVRAYHNGGYYHEEQFLDADDVRELIESLQEYAASTPTTPSEGGGND